VGTPVSVATPAVASTNVTSAVGGQVMTPTVVTSQPSNTQDATGDGGGGAQHPVQQTIQQPQVVILSRVFSLHSN